MNKDEMMALMALMALEPVPGPEHAYALADKEHEVFKTVRYAVMERTASLFMDGKDEQAVAMRDLLRDLDRDVKAREESLRKLGAVLAEVRESAELHGLWTEPKP